MTEWQQKNRVKWQSLLAKHDRSRSDTPFFLSGERGTRQQRLRSAANGRKNWGRVKALMEARGIKTGGST